jgi:hypothetical protein
MRTGELQALIKDLSFEELLIINKLTQLELIKRGFSEKNMEEEQWEYKNKSQWQM